MRASRNFPKRFWRNIALIAVPSAALVGLETYHATAILPDVARRQAAVVHTFQVIDTARSLNEAIQDAERGERGFIITGKTEYLEPYRTGITETPEKITELKKFTEDNQEQQRRLQLLNEQINVKLSELKRALDAYQSGGFDAARQIVETNIGYDTMQVITQLIGFTISTEFKLLQERQTRAAEDQTTSARMSILAGALALVTMLTGIILLMLNLNQVARAQAVSVENEERFRSLLESAPDAMVVVDEEGMIDLVNTQTENLFGYMRAEMVGNSIEMLLPKRYQEQHVQHRRAFFANPRTRPMGAGVELYGRRKDGTEFPVEISLSPFRTHDDVFAFGAVRDISERRQRQLALEQSQAALAQAQKMEAVGHLTGGVAHDFNNLLTAIQGSIELVMRRAGRLDPETERLLGPATSAAERGAALTHRLLAFSRQQTLAPEHIDINRHVAGISELLRRTLGEAIAIETVLAGGLWRCLVDPNQLESALVNLAVNARDAMPDGGKLTIETGNTYLDEEYAATHEEVSSGQYVLLAVSDTGTGMSPETMARALEPFFTTKASGRGTGLGLSQIYGFVKQSGGHIKLYSELGQGTTVKIYLPRSLSGAMPERVPERSASIPTGNGETVLLVEDDVDVREFGASALAHLGYRVLEAVDASTALDLLVEHSEVTLLLTDVGLPGLNGRQLADEARRRLPNLKVVYTTGYARNAIVHHGVLDAGVDLLAKPFTSEGLGRKLQEVLRRD
jgi:PAS domain S-box-containing protein